MHRNLACMALLGCLALPTHADTLAVESMTITDASFTMPVDGFPTYFILNPGPAATLDDGLANGVIDANGSHGSPANPVVSGMFYGMPLNGFFAPSAGGISDPEPGAIGMTLDTGTMALSADLSGLFVEWMNTYSLQGGNATGTAEWIALLLEGGPATFSFRLGWTSAAGTPWSLGGTAVVMMVPEPETWAMLLAGLALVRAAARVGAG